MIIELAIAPTPSSLARPARPVSPVTTSRRLDDAESSRGCGVLRRHPILGVHPTGIPLAAGFGGIPHPDASNGCRRPPRLTHAPAVVAGVIHGAHLRGILFLVRAADAGVARLSYRCRCAGAVTSSLKTASDPGRLRVILTHARSQNPARVLR